MDSKTQLKLEIIKNAILESSDTTRIILFGSYAQGNETDESDLDLCVITDENKRKREILRDIRRAIVDEANIPVDIFIYRSDEFEQKAAIENSFEHIIKESGITLHG
ncbi:MAG TPA: nucleotidyltransferase domain-containing protein [Thermotogota bacterium]|nr:nucleotidyltransferase domain-containing protein [Thermotogota bacterium]HRW35648.1 nucleotidyltransferase domain-containing protein [Thermotogota bacterium]